MEEQYKVLVADDSSFAFRVVLTHLAGTEFQVVGNAKSDVQAVEMFQRLAPDLVLLDVIMPEKGGLEALRRIMEINPQAAVVMLSSLGTEDTVTECLALGAKTFVLKPFEKDVLVKHMRQAVSSRKETANGR